MIIKYNVFNCFNDMKYHKVSCKIAYDAPQVCFALSHRYKTYIRNYARIFRKVTKAFIAILTSNLLLLFFLRKHQFNASCKLSPIMIR